MAIVPDHRFRALDSWRGVCACLVAMFHFPAYSRVHEWAIVRHGHLFVDFFFVLSGFVIASAYEGKLARGGQLGRFMLLRFGRVYPLHLFMLAVYVAFELFYALPNGGSAHGEPFGADRSPLAIATNLALIQGLHVHDRLTWNLPSWSISTEFYTYLLFGLAATFAAARLRAIGAAIIVLAPAALWLTTANGAENTYDFSIVRCVLGFACGVTCLHAFRARANAPRLGTRAATAVEVAAVAGAALFVAYAPTMAQVTCAPFVFAAVVLVFAYEGGAVSGLMTRRPMLVLGALSYSIYMVHLFVQQSIIVEGLVLLQRHTGITWLLPYDFGSSMTLFVGTTLPMGTLAYALMLALVVGVSALTYRFVELPAREWFRRLADRDVAPAIGARP